MIVILIPTYNERDNIPKVLKEIEDLAIADVSVTVIDDASPDGTADAAQRAVKSLAVHVMRRTHKTGLGDAYRAGFAWARERGADVVFEMDADLSHNPRDIARFIDALQNGADMVIGSRRIAGGTITGWNARRHVISWCATHASRVFLGTKTHDITSGFRAYSAQALNAISPHETYSNGYAFQVEMVVRAERAGLLVTEIPIVFHDRKEGRSKLSSLKEGPRFIAALFRLKVHRGIKRNAGSF